MLDSVMRHDSVMLCFQAHERLCAGQPAPVVEVEGLQPPEMSRGAILSYLQVSISKFCGDEYYPKFNNKMSTVNVETKIYLNIYEPNFCIEVTPKGI
jgi:hypothetical protein